MSDATFHILLVAPLRGDEDHATNDAWTKPVRFDRASFDEAMATVAPGLALDLPNPAGGKPIRVDVRFDAMRAFRPDAIVAAVPVLASMQAAAPAPAAGAASLVDDILSGMDAPDERAKTPGGLLERVLAHPAMRSLERAWRGLHFLATRSAGDAKVIVSAVPALPNDVDDVLVRAGRATDLEPVDLIVVDHALGSSARDLEELASWASRAEALGAPLVANGLPELAGVESIAALGRSQRRLRSADDPRASAVRSVAARDVTRWIALAMNGALARPPHSGPVPRAPGVTLDEKEMLFVGPAVMVGALAAASFQRTGWGCSIAGPQHGLLGELPVHVTDGSGTPLEAHATEDATAEAAAAGLMVFASVANKDVAILPHAPTLFRGTAMTGGAPPAAAHGLVDQIFVARFARAIMQLAGAIPADTPHSAAREVASVAFAELFEGAPRKPEVDVKIVGTPPFLEATVHPRGFYGVKLEEATLAAPLG